MMPNYGRIKWCDFLVAIQIKLFTKSLNLTKQVNLIGDNAACVQHQDSDSDRYTEQKLRKIDRLLR